MLLRPFLQRLLAAAVLLVNHTATGADLVNYTASASPGTVHDANDNSVGVWKVEPAAPTKNGLANEAGDPHTWHLASLRRTGLRAAR